MVTGPASELVVVERAGKHQNSYSREEWSGSNDFLTVAIQGFPNLHPSR